MEVAKNIKSVVDKTAPHKSLATSIQTPLALWSLGILSSLLYLFAFPPYTIHTGAFVFAIPLLIAGLSKLGTRHYALLCWIMGSLSWILLIAWLRHVTLGGWIILSLILGFFWGSWFILARYFLSFFLNSRVLIRTLGLIALTGLWVGLEQIRGILFTGFPWLPLAASQAKQPLLLSILPYTGSSGLSAFILFFNLALLSYGWGLGKKRGHQARLGLSLELYLSFALLLLMGYLFMQVRPKKDEEILLFKAGLVQPYTKASLKWDPAEAQQQLRTLKTLSFQLADSPIDVILWPEAATPLPIKGDPFMQNWIENLSKQTQLPLWMGNIAHEDGRWENGCFIVLADQGLLPEYYAKRHLVPFGEYVPLRALWPWIEKIVPLSGDTAPGESARPLKIQIRGQELQMGCLVCYEDVFASLARQTVQEGADFFFVVTNDAWYGEEGAAEQHFTHSILRAVETRRPFVRVGNAGQSGWIDAFGRIRETLKDPQKGPYFEGIGTISVYQDQRFATSLTPYVKRGDQMSLLFFAFSIGFLLIVCPKKKKLLGHNEDTVS